MIKFIYINSEGGKMGIESLLASVVMLIQSASVGEAFTAKNIYQGAVIVDKVITKTEQGTWGASAHEESYQIVKNAIKKIGQK